MNKDYIYKTCYWLKLDRDTKHVDKRVTLKKMKLDENSQYGFAMTKPIPMGCIKKSHNQPGELSMFC